MKKSKVDSVEKVQTVSHLVNKQKARIEQAHLDIIKKAEKLGEQDGSLDLPRTEDSQLSPNEGMIKHEYQKLIADCWNEGKSWLDGPHLTYKANNDELDEFNGDEENFIKKKKDFLDRKKNEQIEFIKKEYNIRQADMENYDKVVQRDYIIAKQELQQIQDQVGRAGPLIHFKSAIMYVLLLLGIGVCEIPLNVQIFQKFGEAFYITIIMASSLAIAIPVLAHFTGVFIKQRKEKREYLFFSIISVLLFFVFNFGVSIFRSYVLAENLGQQVDYLNIGIFTCLNLILFIIGVLAAYFRHDESYELEHAHNVFQKEKKKYDKVKIDIQNKLKGIAEEKNNKIKAVNDGYMAEKAELYNTKNTLRTKRDGAAKLYDELLNSFIALEDYVDACYRIAVEKYRAANLVHRSNHISPKSWEKGMRALDYKFTNSVELDPN